MESPTPSYHDLETQIQTMLVARLREEKDDKYESHVHVPSHLRIGIVNDVIFNRSPVIPGRA